MIHKTTTAFAARKRGRETIALERHYGADEAKRSLGAICAAVHHRKTQVGILGTEDEPWLFLQDEGSVEETRDEIRIAIDAVKANWSAITFAALAFGTTFVITSNKVPQAVLRRHPNNRHPGFAFRTAQSPDIDAIVKRLEEAIAAIRDFGQMTAEFREVLRQFRAEKVEFENIGAKLGDSADLVGKRIRQFWRASNNYEIPAASH